jgi:hypothetical protein
MPLRLELFSCSVVRFVVKWLAVEGGVACSIVRIVPPVVEVRLDQVVSELGPGFSRNYSGEEIGTAFAFAGWPLGVVFASRIVAGQRKLLPLQPCHAMASGASSMRVIDTTTSRAFVTTPTPIELPGSLAMRSRPV